MSAGAISDLDNYFVLDDLVHSVSGRDHGANKIQ